MVFVIVICICTTLILRGGQVKETCSEFVTASSVISMVFSTFQQPLKNYVWFCDKLYPSRTEQRCLND